MVPDLTVTPRVCLRPLASGHTCWSWSVQLAATPSRACSPFFGAGWTPAGPLPFLYPLTVPSTLPPPHFRGPVAGGQLQDTLSRAKSHHPAPQKHLLLRAAGARGPGRGRVVQPRREPWDRGRRADTGPAGAILRAAASSRGAAHGTQTLSSRSLSQVNAPSIPNCSPSSTHQNLWCCLEWIAGISAQRGSSFPSCSSWGPCIY